MPIGPWTQRISEEWALEALVKSNLGLRWHGSQQKKRLDWIGLRILDISNAETPSGSRGFHVNGFCSECQCLQSPLGLQMGHLLVCVLHCRDGRQNQALGFNKVIKILCFSCIFQKEILQQRQIHSRTSDLHPCENLFDENISLYTLSQYISLCEGLERIDADILKV